jgi:hypothetical protein
MRCSHNLPYEQKCIQCVAEAIARVKSLQQAPAPNATDEEKALFWTQAYKNQQPEK